MSVQVDAGSRRAAPVRVHTPDDDVRSIEEGGGRSSREPAQVAEFAEPAVRPRELGRGSLVDVDRRRSRRRDDVGPETPEPHARSGSREFLPADEAKPRDAGRAAPADADRRRSRRLDDADIGTPQSHVRSASREYSPADERPRELGRAEHEPDRRRSRRLDDGELAAGSRVSERPPRSARPGSSSRLLEADLDLHDGTPGQHVDARRRSRLDDDSFDRRTGASATRRVVSRDLDADARASVDRRSSRGLDRVDASRSQLDAFPTMDAGISTKVHAVAPPMKPRDAEASHACC